MKFRRTVCAALMLCLLLALGACSRTNQTETQNTPAASQPAGTTEHKESAAVPEPTAGKAAETAAPEPAETEAPEPAETAAHETMEAEAPEPAETEAPEPAETEPAGQGVIKDTVESGFVWNPYVWSPSLTNAFGESAKETTFNCIEAVMNGEDTFAYVNEEDVFNLFMISYTVCPYLFEVIGYDIVPEQGTARINYVCSAEEAREIIDGFGREVETIIGPVVTESDSDEVKAMLLHYNFSRTLSYDYVASGEAEPEPGDTEEHQLSAYTAIMERTGVCQFFAEALVHLYLQCGLDANLAMGSSPEWGHMFVYMKLDGEEIFIDPTWEDSHNGTGLSFFGINTAFYNDNEYEIDPVLLYDDASYTGVLDSEKYKPLWNMRQLNSISRTDGALVIDFIDAEGNSRTFTAEN